MKSTKEKITHAALILFAEKGFQAVTVAEIAQEVGIKAPSLYKHYSSKEAILQSCIKLFYRRMADIHESLKMPGSPNQAFTYESTTTDQLVQVSLKLFEFYLRDDVAASFRKILLIERYHNDELNQIYEEIFFKNALTHQENIFTHLIEEGSFKHISPRLLALRFYSPIYLLLQQYDRQPDQIQEGKNELELIIREFSELYRMPK